MLEKFSQPAITILSVVLCFFTLVAVNFNIVQPLSALAVFVGLGLLLCFLVYPLHPKLKGVTSLRIVDVVLGLTAAVCCGYVVVQTEPAFQSLWFKGQSLGDRAAAETMTDFYVGLVGVVLVLEATRRSIGWIVPALALLFMAHSYYCYLSEAFGFAQLPWWMLPTAGQDMKGIVGTTFLQSLGVFGKAASVMFQYVFLFVVFGSFLEMSGATQFIIDFAQKVFGRARGGPALVSVLGSGLMGMLSGSAVANAVTTGAFTIPMMRNSGFPKHVAGGITASAASGGALVPPVMGAAAYMMLEIVDPQPSFLEIVRAALIPAALYYISLLAIVFFYSGLLGKKSVSADTAPKRSIWRYEAIVFFSALLVLIGLLGLGFSPFKSVTGSLVAILVLTALRPSLPISIAPRAFVLIAAVLIAVAYWFFFTDPMNEQSTWITVLSEVIKSAIVGMLGMLLFGLIHPAWRPEVVKAFVKSAKAGISLVAASACVGIIIGIVQQTGIASEFSGYIKDVVETSLLIALVGIMCCSLVLGMGVPSVVCYLLMATLMGSLLGEMGVPALAAHFFIFYFGMMSMVTPPVALAGYASASIADAPVMKTSMAAFRFSLVGFSLPYMFIYQPNLLLMPTKEHPLTTFGVALAIAIACLGVITLAAALVGFLDLFWKKSPLSWLARITLFVAAAMLLSPDVTFRGIDYGMYVNITGSLMVLAVAIGVCVLKPLEREPIAEDEPDEVAGVAPAG